MRPKSVLQDLKKINHIREISVKLTGWDYIKYLIKIFYVLIAYIICYMRHIYYLITHVSYLTCDGFILNKSI